MRMADYLMLSIWKDKGAVGCDQNFSVMKGMNQVTTQKNKSEGHMLKVVWKQKKVWLSILTVKWSVFMTRSG